MVEESPETYNFEVLDALVRRVFRIEKIHNGTPKQGFIVRYVGRVVPEDTAAAYDELQRDLKPYGITPLFRQEEDRHSVILVPGMPEPNRSNPVVNLVMFILTLLSVAVTGYFISEGGALPSDTGQAIVHILRTAMPFTVSMLAILGAHEFGHYLMGRRHGVNVSLPYFIPIPYPFSLFGTMGAFINMKEPPKNRRQLLDIGIAGPLSGLIVAIPVLFIGLSLSTLNTLPVVNPSGPTSLLEGNSLIYLLSKWLVFGELLPSPATYGDMNPLAYWVAYFFTGRPVPSGGLDVLVHPVAWAGWAGLLVTGLNLVPAGQLDGGHLLYVLVGRRRAQLVLPFVLVTLVVLGFAWNGWWLWAALIFFLVGRAYAEPLDQITPLDNRRRLLAVLGLIVFILTFIPVPFSYI